MPIHDGNARDAAVPSQSQPDGYATVARVEDIPANRPLRVVIRGRGIMLSQVDGQYYALDDCCPHMAVRLSLGWVRGGVVICPRHTWKFQLADGRCVGNADDRFRIQTHEVRLSGEEIQVRLSGFQAVSDARGSSCGVRDVQVQAPQRSILDRRTITDELNPFEAGSRETPDEPKHDGES